MTSLSFDIFARDHASKQIRDVGDEFDKLNRKIDDTNSRNVKLRSEADALDKGFAKLSKSVGGLGSAFSLLGTSRVTGVLHGVGTEVASLASAAAKMGTSLVATTAQLSLFGAAAASSALGVAELAAALAPAVGALAALPGAASVGAAAIGTLKLALSGVGNVFAEAVKAATVTGDIKPFLDSLKGMAAAVGDVAIEIFQIAPLIKGLQTDAQQGLFGPLVGHIADLIPVLSTLGDGIRIVADQFGQAAVQLLNFVRSAESLAAINSIFGSTRDLLASLRPALEPVLAGFRDLAVVGASFTAGLGPGIAAAAARFGEFLSAAASSGRALDWMNGALEVFKQLGGIAKDVSGILSSVFGALRESGAGALGVVGQLLDKLNSFLSSSQGQFALVEIFTALHRVGEALAPILGAIVAGLATLAPKVADIAQAFAPLIAEIINALVPALKAVAPGVVAVGEALTKAFGRADVQNAIRDLGRGIGDVLKALAPLAAAIVSALAPVLANLVPGILAVSQALSAAFARPEVRDALVHLAQGLANVAIALTPLIAPLVQIAAIIVDRWANALQLLATFLTPITSALADVLAPILPQIADLFGKVSDALKPLIDQLGNGLAEVLRDTKTWLDPVIDALRTVGTEILAHLNEVLPQITPHLGDIARAFADIAKELFKLLPDLIRFGGQLIVDLIDQLPQIVPQLAHMAQTFADMVKNLAPLLPDLLKLGNDFIAKVLPLLPGLIAEFDKLIVDFDELLKKVMPLLDAFLKSPAAFGVISLVASNLKVAIDTLKSAFEGVKGAVEVFLGVFFGAPDLVRKGYTDIVGALKTYFNGISGFIERFVNAIADVVPGMPHIHIQPLAMGGIFDRPTLGLFGEAGPEAVIPLSNPRRARELADASGLTGMLIPPGGAAGAPTVIYNVNVSFGGYPLISQTDIARVVIEAINNAKGQGFNLGVIGSS